MSRPCLEELRESSIAVMLTPILGSFSALKKDVAVKLENENLAMTLAAVTPPLRLKAVFAEVERREQVFAEARSTADRAVGHPRTSALQSVIDDLTKGRYA